MTSTRKTRLCCMVLVAGFCSMCPVRGLAFQASSKRSPSTTKTERDGSHDFDFLIGDWKAHLRRMIERPASPQAIRAPAPGSNMTAFAMTRSF